MFVHKLPFLLKSCLAKEKSPLQTRSIYGEFPGHVLRELYFSILLLWLKYSYKVPMHRYIPSHFMHVGVVAIGNPERHMRKVSQCGSKQQ